MRGQTYYTCPCCLKKVLTDYGRLRAMDRVRRTIPPEVWRRLTAALVRDELQGFVEMFHKGGLFSNLRSRAAAEFARACREITGSGDVVTR